MNDPNLRLIDERDFTRQLRIEQAVDRQQRARIDHLLQAALLVLSLVALWMVTSTDQDTVRRGYIVGLASQPFWIAVIWRTRPLPWGMFIAALAYTLIWLRGIFNAFF